MAIFIFKEQNKKKIEKKISICMCAQNIYITKKKKKKNKQTIVNTQKKNTRLEEEKKKKNFDYLTNKEIF
jgi:hypothetical protein